MSSVKIEIEAQASYEQPWLDSEGQAWIMTGHAAQLDDGRWVVWTTCDEAGTDDIEIVDADAYNSADDAARDWAREIAEGVGTLAKRSDDRHHYSALGSQYQPPGYDRDGYREEYVPE